MRKIILKSSLLASIVVVILYICNYFYTPIALYENNPNYSVIKFKEVPNGIDVCNFGNSQAVDAFANYEGIQGKTCFDFSLSAQTLSYDYRIMQQYADNINKGATVFLTISYFSFQVDEQNEPGFDSKNERYYYFLNPEYIKQFSVKEYCFFKTFPILWHSPIRIIQSIQTCNDTKNSQSNDDKDFSKLAQNAFSGRNVLNEDDKLVIVDSEYDSLVEMIQFCKSHEFKPIIVITPYRKEYNDLFSERFYEQFYDIVNNLCQKNDVTFLDYSHDSRFCNNDNYFLDAYHLSEQGSKAFIQVIDQELLSED